jgi:hypothetical protein
VDEQAARREADAEFDDDIDGSDGVGWPGGGS